MTFHFTLLKMTSIAIVGYYFRCAESLTKHWGVIGPQALPYIKAFVLHYPKFRDMRS